MIPAEIIDMWDFRLFVRACVEMGQTDEIIEILTEENVIPQGEWIRLSARLYKCNDCGYITDVEHPYCAVCGKIMQKGSKNETDN